ncbi:AAA family ATPase [Komagataeibacter sp. AV436]|uniref:AAA family ATPase n=1 Tax=Komagataeibacter melomenusus TaxID=2766578 RepID=A0ABX2ACS3_9PROT|nr:AAA family ATPase [Komagataeibacter melomenusus]MBV1830834.1 AAA family ATPase [Komagataeibacter melomenusus]NPC66158.1 AAA family ATPase [Komagataeibacter melomenusus]
MFLRNIRIKNIRSIRELDLPFGERSKGRKWTYLLGENGTGKSTVLRCLALALAGSDASTELVGIPDEWIRLGEQRAQIEVEFVTASGEPRRSCLTFIRGMTVLEFAIKNKPDLEQLDAALARATRNYFVVGYGVTRRSQSSRYSFSEATSGFRSVRAGAVGTLFNPETTLISLEQWAMDIEYRHGKAGLNVVRKSLNELLPDVKFKGIDRQQRRLMFETRDGILPISALSDGYQTMAAWCGDLLWQITETFNDYRDPLCARGVILVDEIDIHLHPVWQRRLVSFLNKLLPNVQIIATTHSPLTVHQAGENELYVLRRQDNEGVVLQGYEGAPNRLLLPQLLESSLFGLNSLDSLQVQSLREELRELQGIGSSQRRPSAVKDKRIRKIERDLRSVSNWEEVPPYLQRTNLLLERVATMLDPNTESSSPEILTSRSNPDRSKKSE